MAPILSEAAGAARLGNREGRVIGRRKKYDECKGETYAEGEEGLATAILTPEKQLTLRKTTLGGALNTTRLIQQLPDTTRLSVDLYLLLGPAGDLLTCNDPEVTNVTEWKQKSTDVLNRLEDLLKSWRAMAAA